MLLKKNGRFELCPHKVKYIQHGKEIEQWALPNKQWWLDFSNKWEHTEIIEFVEIEFTKEQLQRFKEIAQINTPESFREIYIDYILNGQFPEGYTHPLRDLQIKTEQLQQDEYLVDLDFRQSLSELGV